MAKDAKRLYTTAEIAKRIGYSQQSVRNAMRELGLEPANDSGRSYLYTREQANAVARHYGKRPSFEEKTDDSDKALVEALRSEIVLLEAQVKQKDKTIETLLDSLQSTQAQLTQALDNERVLSGTVAVHAIADNSKPIDGKEQPDEEEDEANEEEPHELTRWEHFKAVFKRKKKG